MNKTRDFRLGSILVEPDRLRVSQEERTVVVQPRVMDVLVALALGGDSVQSRETLEAQVWSDAHVGYHALARAVYEARKALEDVSPGCDLLETIPRRGYRLKIVSTPVAASISSEAAERAFGAHLLTAVVCLLMLGLIMHAIKLHGTPIHFASAAVIVGWTLLRPLVHRS